MKKHIDWSRDFTLGILGGGQLGKMLLDETARLGIRTAVLDPAEDAPAKSRTNRFEVGDLKDYDAVLRFGRSVDMLTYEIEHVNLDALDELEADGLCIRPSPKLLRIVSDKTAQKRFYLENGIPTLPFVEFNNLAEMRAKDFGFPAVWKTARGGYDGRGVQIIKSAKDCRELPDVPGLLEQYLERNREIAVIVARNADGDLVSYDPVEMSFHPTANLVEYLIGPADLSPDISRQAQDIAERTAEAFGLVGIMAVEMFLDDNGIWVNEVAPRPHNSGHHTIESHYVSQHEQLLRAILDLPLGTTKARCPAVMINLLGGETAGAPRYDGLAEATSVEGCYIHIYGKSETRPFRKMGHVTILGDTPEEAIEKSQLVRDTLKVNAHE
ncbi:MAG: 5-(carboxyamino)imidazole ribonucleotide synthase [Gammaproteobacteria bacterium]